MIAPFLLEPVDRRVVAGRRMIRYGALDLIDPELEAIARLVEAIPFEVDLVRGDRTSRGAPSKLKDVGNYW